MKILLTPLFKNQITLLVVAFVLIQLCTQCKKKSSNNTIPDNNTTQTNNTTQDSNTVQDNFPNGVFLTNNTSQVGEFGTVNFFSIAKSENLNTDIFKNVNDIPLEDKIQSMSIANNKGYIVLSKDKVEVVSILDFKRTATISGLKLPRYFLAINATLGYISQWGNTGTIEIVDLNTNKVINTITTPGQPEQMVKINDKVFVCCSGGDKVIVINTNTNSIENTIDVKTAPTYIKADKDGKVWVLCQGKMSDDFINIETAGSLVKINPNSYAIETTLTFPSDAKAQPALLETNQAQDALYYRYGNDIYKMGISSSAVNTTNPFVTNSKSASLDAIGVNKNNDNVYIGYSPDIDSNSIVYRYTNTGTAIDNFSSGGIGINGFIFK